MNDELKKYERNNMLSFKLLQLYNLLCLINKIKVSNAIIVKYWNISKIFIILLFYIILGNPDYANYYLLFNIYIKSII